MTDTPPLDTDWHGNALDMHIEESRSTFSMRRFGPYINIGVVGGQVRPACWPSGSRSVQF